MLNSSNRHNLLSYPRKQTRIKGLGSTCSNDEAIGVTNLSQQSKLKNLLSKPSMNKSSHFELENDSFYSDIDKIGSKVFSKELEEDTFTKIFSTYLKAFALIYVLPEEDWQAETIDKLLQEGEELFNQSEDDLVAGQRVRRNFKLEGHNFTVELKPIYGGDPKTPLNLRPEHIIKNLKSVLQGFFSTAHYCLLLCSTGYLLLWRRRKLFFIMDIKGSTVDDSMTVRHGLDMLVCLHTIDKVVHLISNLSGIKPNDTFSIREISVVRLITPEGRVFVRESNTESVEYNVINKNYAYLKSTLHLSLNPENTLRNQSSLIVGVAALLASKIDHPASWNTNMFDRLMCYGVQLFRSCWGANLRNRLPIDLYKFPTQLRLGQFVVEMRLVPNIATGQWRCGVCYRGNDFERLMRHSLMNYGNCLFEINKQIYAVWLKDGFYYLLDPYRHAVIGSLAGDDDKNTKWATVRMFRDWTTMLSVFHQMLKASNRNSKFSLHAVCIRNIAKCPLGYALKPLPLETDYEVNSMNETITFSDDVKDCLQLLGKLSECPLDVFSETGETLELENFRLLGVEDFQSASEINSNFAELFNQSPTAPHNSKVLKRPFSRSSTTNRKRQQVTTQSKQSKINTDMRTPNATKTSIRTIARKKGGAETNFADNKQNVPTPKTKACVSRTVRNTPNVNAEIFKCKCEKNCNIGFGDQGQVKATSQTSYQTAGLPPSKCDFDSIPRPPFPIYSKYPHKLAVAGSESGTLESLHRLLKSAFSATNRVLIMTPWGNYVIFRHSVDKRTKRFYVFDGCTCDIDRFRHLDLKNGTAGLIPFDNQSEVVCYMIDSRETRALELLRSRLEEPSGQVKNLLCRGA